MSLWAPPTMSFKNRVPLKGIYEWGVNSKVTKQSNHYVKDTSERVVRRCDDTVDKKRVNSCVLKHLFLERVEQPKISPKKPENTLSDSLLMSCFQKIAAQQKKNRAPRGIWKSRFARF